MLGVLTVVFYPLKIVCCRSSCLPCVLHRADRLAVQLAARAKTSPTDLGAYDDPQDNKDLTDLQSGEPPLLPSSSRHLSIWYAATLLLWPICRLAASLSLIVCLSISHRFTPSAHSICPSICPTQSGANIRIPVSISKLVCLVILFSV